MQLFVLIRFIVKEIPQQHPWLAEYLQTTENSVPLFICCIWHCSVSMISIQLNGMLLTTREPHSLADMQMNRAEVTTK